MFRLILKSVKETLGRDYLIELIKKCVLDMCFRKILFKVIIEVIVDDENGYKDLNDLPLKNMKFKYIDSDTFQGMLKANGMDVWMKRLLDTDLDKGFDIVLDL